MNRLPAMTMEKPRYVELEDLRLAYWCWGAEAKDKPVAVLVHGTAFVAATWRPVAEALAQDYRVYAFDRRGHGYSGAPKNDCYHFREFAEDLVGFMDALGLKGAYGIGHSGGGTDMLLAAGMRQDLFQRLFIMEPTVADPDLPSQGDRRLPPEYQAHIDNAKKRRAIYPSREAVYERYSTRAPLNLWRPEVLKDYIQYGFADEADGTVSLLCNPERESAILEPIMLTMLNRYRGDDQGNPFRLLKQVDCPTLITSSAHSPLPFYVPMADIAARAVGGASRSTFPHLSHCVPQESPETLLEAVRAFAGEV